MKKTVKTLTGHTWTAEPYEPQSAKPKPSKLSSSQARRLIRDLQWFVNEGDITKAQYQKARAAIVARLGGA